jgi:hypothetical protein
MMSLARSKLRLLVPAYVYPLEDRQGWDHLASFGSQATAIINPFNGPGERLDPNYLAAIETLRDAQVELVGYIDAAYGTRLALHIEDDISRYAEFYNIRNFFFDQMPWQLTDEVQQIAVLARAHDPQLIIANPGAPVIDEYIDLFDCVCVYENSFDDFQTQTVVDAKDVTIKNYSTSGLSPKVAHLIYSVPEKSIDYLLNACSERGATWVSLCGDDVTEPWCNLRILSKIR